MDIFDRASKIAAFIRGRVTDIPDTAIVLGSGLGTFGNSIERETVIPYSDIPDFPVPTVKGHSGNLIFGSVSGKRIIAMQGRFHYYEGYDMDDVTLYVRVFSLLGVKNLILTNAAGAINTSYKPGDFMIITDHIGVFCPSPLRGANDERFGTRFPSLCGAYNSDLIEIAKKSAADAGIDIKEGIYCYHRGPMFETPAEIRMMRICGADACGMSTVPEVIVAVHCGIRCLGISCLTNMAAGVGNAVLSHEDVVRQSSRSEAAFSALIAGICKNI